MLLYFRLQHKDDCKRMQPCKSSFENTARPHHKCWLNTPAVHCSSTWLLYNWFFQQVDWEFQHPKTFSLLHRTAVRMIFQLGCGSIVFYKRKLMARAMVPLGQVQALAHCPSQEQSVVQESPSIWRQRKTSGKWDSVSQKKQMFVKVWLKILEKKGKPLDKPSPAIPPSLVYI